MIRFIIFLIYATLIIILSLPGLPLIALLGKINKAAKDKFCRACVLRIYRGALFIGGAKTTVIGLENLPPEGEAVLYVGNHRSYYDILISYSHIRRHCGFIAKSEMEKIPVVKHWMLNVYCLFLNRKDPKEGLKTILQAIEQVKQGISVFIFPEGTRNTSDTLLNFKEGSFKIAQKSGCKIIPVVQNNNNALLEDHFPLLKKAHTVIEFGKPIDLNELSADDRKHIGAYTQAIMQEMYNKNQALV